MGNCAQRLGRDCGFKYQNYYGQNPEDLDEYLREVHISPFFIQNNLPKQAINRKSKLNMRSDSQIGTCLLEV